MAVAWFVAGVMTGILLAAAVVVVRKHRRSGALRELYRRGRDVVQGDLSKAIVTDELSDVDPLSRIAEDLRVLLVRQRGETDELRHTVQQVLDSIGDGVLALSREGRIVYANGRAADMFEFEETLGGKQFLEVARKHSLAAAFDRALRGSVAVERTTIPSGDGNRVIEIRASPVRGSADVAAVVVFVDVTEITQLQRVRSEFIDDFSHEVRTPLAGLRTAAESFDRGLPPEDESRLRAIMLRQLGRLERLIGDLSELNHIESGAIRLQRSSVDLLALARDTCEEFRRRYPDVAFAISGETTLASADPARMQQILANLIDNACKHGGDAGEVRVDVSSADDVAVITVLDEGQGIPATDIDRIFHRFYRVDRSRSQHVPGLGLGLAIAKHLTSAQGGSIRAYNRREGGAAFEVRLPLEPVGVVQHAGS